MRFGICADLRGAKEVAQAGFDYIEGGLSGLAALDEGTYGEIVRAVEESGLRAEAFNVMLPGTQRLTGPVADLYAAKAYLAPALQRAARLGARVIVFGSGGARGVPEGWPMDQAFAQLVDFLRLAGPMAAQHGIAIAVEPLRPQECNIINTVTEGLALARAAAQPNVGTLADWYHMTEQSEGVQGMLDAGPALLHCHIAAPGNRRYPLPGDGADYSAFFGALRAIGYAGRVSVEGGGKPEEYAATLKRLKEEFV